jgi:hypothetical protein
VNPSCATTGTSISSCVMGQMYSCGGWVHIGQNTEESLSVYGDSFPPHPIICTRAHSSQYTCPILHRVNCWGWETTSQKGHGPLIGACYVFCRFFLLLFMPLRIDPWFFFSLYTIMFWPAPD